MERVAACTRNCLTIPVGEGIELRGVSSTDCSELYAAIDRNRIRLRTWLPWASDTFSSDDLIEFVRQREIDNVAGISLTTNIWLEGLLCGAIGLHAIDPGNRNTSIGYWLDGAHEGRGIMTRACRAIVTEGFRQYGLHRIEIRCAVGNDRSSAIARRLGFVEEAILRDAEWLRGRWVDLRVFSMLEQDWKA
jgi:ribosomal-protein-serine acetyltransferase